MRRRIEWAFQTPERAKYGNGPIVTGEGDAAEADARAFVAAHPAASVLRRTVDVSDWEEGA